MTSSEPKPKADLLNTITHCPNVKAHFRNQATPCREIIDSQGVSALEDFQVPEPWNGKIERAPLLFISSNPSISEKEQYPTWNAPETHLLDFFQHRFGGGEKQWVKDGKYALAQDGSYERATPYWSEIKNRASELLGKPAIPGTDYTINEIVHCKSRNNIGVDEALKECAQRYLSRVLEISSAEVVVISARKRNVISRTLWTSMRAKAWPGRCSVAEEKGRFSFYPLLDQVYLERLTKYSPKKSRK